MSVDLAGTDLAGGEAHPPTAAHELVSADVPDWTREHKRWFQWAPARSLLASIRSYQRYSASPNPFSVVLKQVAVIRHRWWTVITGADIPVNVRIEGGLLLPHPNGVVIHPNARIGPNCLLFQQVTIGAGNGGIPVLEGHVDVGAGAKIIGGVTVARHAKIGANAVVVRDVPEGATAVGVPARIIAG